MCFALRCPNETFLLVSNDLKHIAAEITLPHSVSSALKLKQLHQYLHCYRNETIINNNGNNDTFRKHRF